MIEIRDGTIHFLDNTYVEIIVLPLTTQQLKEKKKHNQAMLEIATALRYVEFDDIKAARLQKKCRIYCRPFMEETRMS